ncbi:MAG: response regulator [Campylobacterota bacterium]|nr:response regulator [Campylobacterota bacterium]
MDENIFYDEFINKLQIMESILADAQTETFDIDELFRAVHTIKGTADILGMIDIVNITHKAEDLLDEIRVGNLTMSPVLIKLFLELKKFIELMIENILNGLNDDEDMINNLTLHFEKELLSSMPNQQKESKIILVVDDSLVIRQRVKLIGQELGYLVVTANNGIDGIEQLKKNKVDLLLCDVSVDEIGGLDMLLEVKKNKKYIDLPIVILVLNKNKDIKSIAKDTDAKAWLMKPFDKSRFLIVLDKIIG